MGILADNTNGNKLTITANLRVGNSESWINNSNNVINIFGGVDLNSQALTFSGTGNFQVDGVISNGGILPDTGSIIFVRPWHPGIYRHEYLRRPYVG